MTIDTFIKKHKITGSVQCVDNNPYMDDMPRGSSHWKVTIRRGRQAMVTPFSMGPALKGPPALADILNNLASDASIASMDFDDFVSDFGIDVEDPDARRKAKKSFNATVRLTESLERVLGPEAMDELVNDVERL